MAQLTLARWSRRGRTAVTVAAVAAAALVGTLVGANGFATTDGSLTDRWVESAAAAREYGPLTFPAQEPSGLIDVHFSMISRVGPIGRFSSSGEPTVAVCPATSEECRRALPTSTILVSRGGGPTVLVVPGEPTTRPLSAEAERYWRTVGFVSVTPGWFPR